VITELSTLLVPTIIKHETSFWNKTINGIYCSRTKQASSKHDRSHLCISKEVFVVEDAADCLIRVRRLQAGPNG